MLARLSIADLLDAVDRGRDRGAIERALILLGLTGERERDRQALAEVSVGARDAALFALRERAFGRNLALTSHCPRCPERLESELDLARLFAERAAAKEQEEWTLAEDGFELALRLPSSADLLAAAGAAEGEARRILLRRCVRVARGSDEVPDALLARAIEELGRADRGDVELALECPACGHAFSASFDIASFFWRELEVWAERVLDDVHLLARAYGWREGDILTLSPERRRAYVERVLA